MINGIHVSLHQFGIQLFGMLLVAIYAMLVTFIILDKITHIRTTKEQQIEGLDKTLLHQNYNDKK